MKSLILVPSELELSHLLPERPRPDLVGRLAVFSEANCLWAVCGIGPAASALATAHLLANYRPRRVVLAGIAGAFRESGLRPGDLVQAGSECFADLGYREGDRFVTLDEMHLPMLPTAAGSISCSFELEGLLAQLETLAFITVSTITSDKGRARALYACFAAALENMEGAAVAAACRLADVPFHEIRAVSNFVGPRHPSTWQVAEPLRHLGARLRAELA